MQRRVNNMKSSGFDAELTSILLAALATSLLCALTIASTVLKGAPRSNDFNRFASKHDKSSDPSIADEWDEVFDTARSVIATLPALSRIEKNIMDPALQSIVYRV